MTLLRAALLNGNCKHMRQLNQISVGSLTDKSTVALRGGSTLWQQQDEQASALTARAKVFGSRPR
jgi:hypothetical protein